MKSFIDATYITNVLKLKQFINYVPLFTYVILSIFISLFIVHRTTIPNGYNLYWFEPLTNGLRVTLFILGLIYCCGESKLKIIMCCCYFAFSFATYKIGNSWVLFDLFFIPLFLSKRLNLTIVIELFFYLILLGTIVTIALDLCGCLPKFPVNFYKGTQIRYNLGFSHPNSLGMMFMLVSMLLVLKVKKMNFLCFLSLSILGSLCVIFPKSYSSALIVYCLSLFSFFKMIIKNLSFELSRKIVRFFALGVFSSVIIGTYVVALTGWANDGPLNLPQSLLSRFILGAKAFTRYGFSLFGQDYHPVGTTAIMYGADPSTYFVVDCLYFYMPIFVGVLPTLVYLSLFYRSAWISIERANYALLFVLIMVSIYSISEYLVVFPLFMFVYFDYGAQVKQNSCVSFQ